METWKQVRGYEDLYEVSTKGNVRSKKKQLTLRKNQGYMMVDLSREDRGKKPFRVHRLVAEAFLDNPDNKPMVNHKDRNRSNNDVNNLEWCNAIENNHHFRGIKHNNRKLFIKDANTGEVIDVIDLTNKTYIVKNTT